MSASWTRLALRNQAERLAAELAARKTPLPERIESPAPYGPAESLAFERQRDRDDDRFEELCGMTREEMEQ